MAAQVLDHLSICRASDCDRGLFGRHECDGQAVEHRKLLAAIVRESFLFRLDGKLLVRMMVEARLLPC
ncbi:hypothetical protein [Bradyrhizobium elkanii]|uniref:hypothetical protein n=1 Tax=Bradyrhizobium elkanii TaxID=29448 RepID=UPI001BAD14D5|nr:hypothetical protein [Bradyrhizobium elkanii]MBR1164903.1 hypothetical protein [Bradyrhizobium elkanii]